MLFVVHQPLQLFGLLAVEQKLMEHLQKNKQSDLMLLPTFSLKCYAMKINKMDIWQKKLYARLATLLY